MVHIFYDSPELRSQRGLKEDIHGFMELLELTDQVRGKVYEFLCRMECRM